jgi:hypothetical protein
MEYFMIFNYDFWYLGQLGTINLRSMFSYAVRGIVSYNNRKLIIILDASQNF